jgi:hypothetical protein
MVKRTDGNLPLTSYERSVGFASSSYGTTTQRLAGYAQYQRGDCALSLTKLDGTALCTPSGYLYSHDAILSYLLNQTQLLNRQRDAYEDQERKRFILENKEAIEAQHRERLSKFAESQQSLIGITTTNSTEIVVASTGTALLEKGTKKRKLGSTTSPTNPTDVEIARANLKRTSFWLAESQPVAPEPNQVRKPADRPCSPTSSSPDLRRKDLWPVKLRWNDERTHLICAVSDTVLKSTMSITAYWTVEHPGKFATTVEYLHDSHNKGDSGFGTLVATAVFETFLGTNGGKVDTTPKYPRCPLSGKKIRHTRLLQAGGSSFAASGQPIEAQKYQPTIT